MRPREYDFDWNLPDDTPCFVSASIMGSDYAGDCLNPPDYREVEITVYIPRTPEPHEGPMLVDVTEEQTEDFLIEMRSKALQMEDDVYTAACEDAKMRRREELDDAARRRFFTGDRDNDDETL